MSLRERKRTAAALIAVVAIAGLSIGGQAGTGDQSVKVRTGDTLAAIANRYGVSVSAIAQANGISNPNLIIIGQTLVIPGTAAVVPAPATTVTTHKVNAGENLTMIAATYGTSAAVIAKANKLRNPNIVVIGTTLAIPVASTAMLPAKLLAAPERLALRPVFQQWASAYGVPADLLQAVAWIESGWQSTVVSTKGALGIGQLMPATVDYMRVVIGDSTLDPLNPEHNIRMSARMLAYLLGRTGRDVRVSLAAYYQGLRSVREQGLLPQTEAYIGAVLAMRPRFG